MLSGFGGTTLSVPLKMQYKPVTRVENFCAPGSESFRNACYAVASGAYDLVMATGVEKLKDSGYSGLAYANRPDDGTEEAISALAVFSYLVSAYAMKYLVTSYALYDVMNENALNIYQYD